MALKTDRGIKMALVKRFEELWIWQETHELVKLIYQDFKNGTPGQNDYGFKNQIQRAGVSIMNNIAEGFEKYGAADSARFFDIAKGSCGEVRSIYYTAEDLKYITTETTQNRCNKTEKISKGIAGYTRTLRQKK